MIDERMEENAALFALDLLDESERLSFEAALSHDPALGRLVAELRESANCIPLAVSAPVPPERLRTRILNSVAATQVKPADASGKTNSSSKAAMFPLISWIGWAVAACFAVTAAYWGSRYLTAKSEIAVLRNSHELAVMENQGLRQRLEAEHILASKQIEDLKLAGDLAELKIAKLVSLTDNSPLALAIAVWNPLKQEGLLAVEKLPALQRDQDYQLWVVDPKYANPVSGGVFVVDERGTAHIRFRPDHPITAATQFAVSRERKGGVLKAEGPIVMAGSL